MNRMLLFLVIFCISPVVAADELYEFHKVSCNAEFSEIQVEQVAFYNIHETVWPDKVSDWKAHVAKMKRLEHDHGLFVFDRLYGYYDADPISITCGKSRLDIKYSRGEYTDAYMAPGEKREYRRSPTANFYYSGKLVSKSVYLGSFGIRRIRVSDSGHDSGIIEACKDDKCDWLGSGNAPLEGPSYERLFSPKFKK